MRKHSRSGWNGVTLPTVGRTRRKLAELLCQLTGWLVEAHNIQRTNPSIQHWEDCCAWDAWATVPAQEGRPPLKAHIYSWCRMKDCVRFGVAKVGSPFAGKEPYDIEVCANEPK